MDEDQVPSVLLHLPPEIALLVVANLDPQNMANLAQTCSYLSTLCKDNANMLWKAFVDARWHIFSDRKDINWERYYKERALVTKDGSFEWKKQDFKTKPAPRMCHTGASTPDGNSIVYIGGQCGQTQRFDEIFQFDGKQFTALNSLMNANGVGARGCPPKFARHTTVAIGNKLFTFGGFDGMGLYFSLAVFDLDTLTWSYPETKGETPMLRTNHAAAAVGTKMFIYGGNRTENENYMILDDMHVLDTETMTWEKPRCSGEIPGARVAHKLMAVGKRVYLFGGGVWTPKKDWLEKSNTMYILDTDTMHWEKMAAAGPEVKASSFAIPFTFSHWIFIYGGQALKDGVEIDDLVSFDTVSLTWHKHTVNAKANPGARSVGTANFAGGSVWLFGGSGSHNLENSVHKLSHPLFVRARTYIRADP
jgi:N-acetylneuraminic acid mutarotase